MNKAEEVIRRLQEKTAVFTLKLLGSNKNKADGFYIMMLNQLVTSTKNDVFHLVTQNTIDLLREADIKFEIETGGGGFEKPTKTIIYSYGSETTMKDLAAMECLQLLNEMKKQMIEEEPTRFAPRIDAPTWLFKRDVERLKEFSVDELIDTQKKYILQMRIINQKVRGE